MLRFWHTPRRKITSNDGEIVSPADGNIIYIKKIEKNGIPISVKGKTFSKLEELTKTDILNVPCWLIGINMTPFDVHKNCAPIDGEVIINDHFDGKFLSLKDPSALSDNERNTYIIKKNDLQIGIVQIASKRVRRIDSYVRVGEQVKKGDWLGMIRFGSQVDLILPLSYKVQVNLKQQVYAGTTVLAKKIGE